MAKQTINQGVAPTGAGGDTFRSGSAKLQANDDEIYAQLGATPQGVLPATLPINKGGTGAASTSEARTNLNVPHIGEFGLGRPNDLRSIDTSSPAKLLGVGLRFGLMSHKQIGSADSPWYASLLLNAHADDSAAGAAPAILAFGVGNMYLKTPNANGDAWVRTTTMLSDANTVRDSNGFIKAASPIVQLFADKIEMNDEAQQQDISFEKLGVGDYLVKGSSGFAQESWYIETPKDANGNVLFSVIYTTLENGDISVKTYKKKLDLETASIVADLDNPVDIPEARWIDLRLQELPQPEIEELESIAPPEFQPTGLAQAVATVMESYHDTEQ